MAASRNYFGSVSDGTYVTPQSNGSWTAGSTTTSRRCMPLKSFYAGSVSSESWTASQIKEHRTFVMDRQLRAGTISGVTVKCYVAGFETNANMNVRPRLEVYIVSANFATVRGTLLAIANYGSGNEVPVSAATPQGICFADGDTVSTVTGIQDGDRVVIKLGATDTSGASPALSLYYGGTESDVAEDESTTGNHAGWIEFSDDRIFCPLPYLIGIFGNPADNGTGAADPTTCDFAANYTLQAGDLVCMLAQLRGAGSALAISDAGGQSWTTEAAVNDAAAVCRLGLFWATFNGTWSSTPSVDFPSASCNTVVGFAVRGSSTASVWAVDQAQVELDFVAGSSPFTKTITGQTTTKRNTVTIMALGAGDDNTYGAQTGAGWVAPKNSASGVQFRNLASLDQGCAVMLKVQAVAGATGNVSLDQLTNGGDAGTSLIITLYENPQPLLLGGGTTPTGALTRQTGKALAGVATPAGTLARSISKALGGAITPTGATAKLIARTFAGAIAPAGALLKLVAITLVGSVLVTGALVKATAKLLAGIVEPIGTIAKQISKTLAGVVAPIGSLVKLVAKLLGGGVTPSSALEHSAFSTTFVAVTATVEERSRVRMTEIREDNAGTLVIEERERVMLAVEEED